MHRPILSLTLVVVFSSGAQAQPTERFQLEKTDSGYVRMDVQTGEMSICEERNRQLVCRSSADERAAVNDEADRLQGRLDRLEERLAKLEAEKQTAAEMPSEKEFDQELDRMESVFRRFMGIFREFEGKPETLPDRT